MMLPVLHIKTPGVPCLVLVNGVIAGETTDLPVIPVSPNGKAYVTCLPLYGGGGVAALPFTVGLEFCAGTMTGPLSGGRAHICPQGGIFLDLEPQLLPIQAQPTSPYSVSRVDFRRGNNHYTATAYFESGLHVAIDNRNSDALDALHTPADLSDCSLSVASCFSDADVFLSGEGPRGNRLIVYSPTPSGYRPVIDEYASGGIIAGDDGNAVQCIRNLDDVCGHQARYTLHMEDGSIVRSQQEYGYFSAPPKEPNRTRDICVAFCEAVSLGMLDEAASLMTPALAEGLDIEDIADFMGDFDHAYSFCGDTREDELWLAYPLLDNCYTIRLFHFDMETGLIGNIREE